MVKYVQQVTQLWDGERILNDDNVRAVAVWNIEHDGGRDGERLDAAVDVLREYRPDIWLRQETTYSHLDGRRRLFRIEEALGMRGFLAEPELNTTRPNAASTNPTAIFIRPETIQVVAEYAQRPYSQNAMTNIVVKFRGTKREVILASFHLSHADPDLRLSEARKLGNFGKDGQIAILGGDCNSYPEPGAPGEPELPDWPSIENKTLYVNRCWMAEDGRMVTDIRPDQILRKGDLLLDPMRYLAGRITEYNLKDCGTASLWRTDQGNRQRIDRAYMSTYLATAIVHTEVIADERVRAASDHALVMVYLDMMRLRYLLGDTEAAETPAVGALTGHGASLVSQVTPAVQGAAGRLVPAVSGL